VFNRERDNHIRTMWGLRLEQGYSKINIITTDAKYISGSSYYEEGFYSSEWFEPGFADLQNLLSSPNIFQEEDLVLERLFSVS